MWTCTPMATSSYPATPRAVRALPPQVLHSRTSAVGWTRTPSCSTASGARVWATYLGGISVDFAWAVTAHLPDLFYIAGNTSSANGVATAGAHDVNLTGPDESLIAKYNYMSVVLPIELLAFGAEPESLQHVRATWTTASESNNAFFTVERAADAVPTSPL
jgi:hypothetical protein